MVWAKTLPLIIAGILNILIGLFVLSRNKKDLVNLTFCIFTVSLGGWVIGIAGFLFANDPAVALWWGKIFYVFPILVGGSIVLFGNAFPDTKRISPKVYLPAIVGCLAIVLPLITNSNFLTRGVVYHSWGKEITLNHTHYLLYSAYLLVAIMFGLGEMYLVAKNRKDLYAQQAKLFFYGFLATSLFGVFFNLVLPWVGNYRLIHIGPLFTNIFVIVVGYSIIRRRMFDVRLVAVRSVAYLLTLSSVAAIFGVILFFISHIFFDFRPSLGVEAAVSVVLAFAALIFNKIKNYFDHITNSLFYRDGYDGQTLIDTLNRLFVDNADLTKLLKSSADIIGSTLKSEFCFFRLGSDNAGLGMIVGNRPYQTEPEDLALFQHLLPKIHDKLIVTNNLGSKHRDMSQLLDKYGVAVVCQLATRPGKAGEKLGFLILGERRSGNPYTAKDLRILEIIVNELVIAIENSLRFEEIQQFNATLQEKINVATQNLRRTNKKLHDLDETKDEFITMASHQLRTPLTSVKGYLSMVLEGDAGEINKQQRELLTQSFLSAQRMVFLISDLLNLSRLNTGKFVIETAPVQLLDIVRSEVDQLRETAHARQVTLDLHMPETLPPLLLDETKIHQVVMNFMDNAIYYTPAGGNIEVSLRETPSVVEYMVRDNGIGVPKAEQHRLFTKFYRAGNARQARPDGTGLGLFMAKKVIVAQGGVVLFDSQEGKGSSFGFRFNKADHSAANAVPATGVPTTIAKTAVAAKK